MAETNLDVVANNPNTVQIAQSSGLMIARNLVDEQTSNYKFGANPAVGTSEEVVWDAGGDYVFLTAAEKMKVASDNVADVYNTGDGAWDVLIIGMDANYNEISEIVELNGKTNVLTTNAYIRVYRCMVLHGGSDAVKTINGGNIGTITIIGETTATKQAQINPNKGQTLMCVLTVPAGYAMYITSLSYASAKRDDVLVQAKFRNDVLDNNGVFSVKYEDVLYETIFNNPFSIPIGIPEYTDMIITATNLGTGNAYVTSSWDYILIKND